MRTILILSLLAWAATCGALDVPALIDAAPPASDFPDADIVVLHQSESITVDELGRVTRHVHTVRRLQTQWAMRRRADVRIPWDGSRQVLEDVHARTYMRDGAVRETPDNGYNEVTPGAVGRAVPFLDIRELVVSHIGTEPGCVVELEYTLRDRDPAATIPQGTCWLGGEHPVLTAVCEVTGPGLARVEGVANGWTLLWNETGGRAELHDLPALAEVPHDQRGHVLPHVTWTTRTGRAADHSAFAASVRAASEPNAVAGPLLSAWLEDTRQSPDLLTDGDLVAAIATLIHDEIAGVAPPTGPWARAPRPAEAAFESAVGTDWERALVAIALLREAGFEPELGLFARDEGVRHDAGTPTHLRVVAQVGQRNWWLAPDRGEAWTGRCDLDGFHGVFLGAGGDQRHYQVRTEALGCRWTARVFPDGDSWQAEADLVLTGLSRSPDDPRELAESLAARLLEDGELGDFELRERSAAGVAIRFSATGSALASTKDGLIWYERIWPDAVQPAALLGQADLDHATRRVPVRVDRGAVIDGELVVELPDHWQVDNPAANQGEHSAGPLRSQWQRRYEDRRLRRTEHLELEAATITPDQWPAFRAVAMRAIGDLTRPEVVITGE